MARRNGGWTDVFWTWGTGAVLAGAALWPIGDAGPEPRQWLVAAFMLIWGVRLGLYLTPRVAGHPEDIRYAAFREGDARTYPFRMLFVTLPQAPASALLAISVVLAARRMERLKALRAEIEAEGGDAHVVELDVTDHDSIKSAVAHAETEVGSIDILINNSGVSTTQRLQDVSPDDYDLMFNTNVKGAFSGAQEVGKRMLARAKGSAPGSYTGGRIVNIASMAGLRVLPQIGVYCMSKAAVVHMTRSMAMEWGKFGINVNAICPGYIDTEINHHHWQTEQGQKLVNMLPRKRVGSPEDLDALLVMLASDQSHFINGAVIAADDGFAALRAIPRGGRHRWPGKASSTVALARRARPAAEARGPRRWHCSTALASPPMRILLAEDDHNLGTWLSRALEHAGIQVEWVNDGRLADRALQQHDNYDALVLDLGLPGLDGQAVLQRLRDRDQRLPALILTARDSLDERVRSLNAGADDFLAKPFALAELEARLHALVRRARGNEHPRLACGALVYDNPRKQFTLH
eukprot:gene15556-32863_t